MTRNRERRLFKDESGVALLEFSIVASLFLILCLGTYDVGRALTHHLMATQLAREGLRKAIGTRGLETGQYILSDSSGSPLCSYKGSLSAGISSCPGGSKQLSVLQSIYQTELATEGRESISVAPNSRQIVIEYAYQPTAPPANITVTINFKYRGLTGTFYDVPVSASLTSAYL